MTDPVRHYIFDIDGTLSIVGDRVKELEKDPKDWNSFYNRCGEDKLNEPVARLCRVMLMTNQPVTLLTGRRESTREITLTWLRDQSLDINSFNLLMRPNGDMRHDTIVKPELLAKAGIEPVVVFEDRNSMVEYWRSVGVCCCQVAEGDF